MLLPEPPMPKPHFNICVSSDGGDGEEYLKAEGGPVWVEGGVREHSDLRTNKTAAVAASGES